MMLLPNGRKGDEKSTTVVVNYIYNTFMRIDDDIEMKEKNIFYPNAAE